MSYARKSYCDVYVFLEGSGNLCCMWCSLGPDFRTKTTAAMLAHLHEHRARGEDVPDGTLEELAECATENDRWMAISDEERRKEEEARSL